MVEAQLSSVEASLSNHAAISCGDRRAYVAFGWRGNANAGSDIIDLGLSLSLPQDAVYGFHNYYFFVTLSI